MGATRRSGPGWALAMALAVVLAGTHAASAAKTTASTEDGYWDDIAWSDGAPAEGDTVTIGHNVTLTNAPPAPGGAGTRAAARFLPSGFP